MKTVLHGSTLLLAEISELTAANSSAVREEAQSKLQAGVTSIDVDLSGTKFVDSSGLGVLIALHKTVGARGGQLRILNPSPTSQQILEVTRLHRLFEVVRT